MIQLDCLLSLVEGVLVTVYLGQYRTKLHLESRNYNKFSHSVANRFLLKIYALSRQVL
jgi:hypothetical protein